MQIFIGLFLFVTRFRPEGELLFFARTKKTNEKKVRPGRMVAARLPSSFVAWCHRSARPIRGRASLKWSSLTISDSRASLLSILKGEVEEQEQEQGEKCEVFFVLLCRIEFTSMTLTGQVEGRVCNCLGTSRLHQKFSTLFSDTGRLDEVRNLVLLQLISLLTASSQVFWLFRKWGGASLASFRMDSSSVVDALLLPAIFMQSARRYLASTPG